MNIGTKKTNKKLDNSKYQRILKFIRNLRSQSSVEYLMIIAITIGIIMPTTYLFFRFSSQSTDKIEDTQALQIGTFLIDNAETIYFSGEGSKVILKLTMPENILDINIIDNRELVFNISNSYGGTESVFFSLVNITSQNCLDNVCSLSEIAGKGSKNVKLESINKGKSIIITKP